MIISILNWGSPFSSGTLNKCSIFTYYFCLLFQWISECVSQSVRRSVIRRKLSLKLIQSEEASVRVLYSLNSKQILNNGLNHQSPNTLLIHYVPSYLLWLAWGIWRWVVTPVGDVTDNDGVTGCLVCFASSGIGMLNESPVDKLENGRMCVFSL